VLLFYLVSVACFAGPKDMSYRIVKEGDYEQVIVSTGLSSYTFSEDGGTLKSAFLSFAPYGSSVAELVPGTKTDSDSLERQYLSNVNFPFTTIAESDQPFTYTLIGVNQVSPEELVIEFQGTADSLAVHKKFTVYNNPYYTIDLQVNVENSSEQPVPIKMTVGDYTPTEKGPSLVYQFDGKAASDLLAPESYSSFDGVGLMDKTTVFFLKTGSNIGVTPFMTRQQSGNKRFGAELTAKPGTTSYFFSLYGGRRQYLLMENSGLGTLDDPGTAARLIIPVVQFLNLLYRYTGNYGWAILLFTLITRVVLFPLMRRQYHSMAKMQKLQPKMKKIQERFKDDRQIMQQKLMEMYKKEGVNPMGGCLPLFIQLPILILLWKAILYCSPFIRLSPGFLWIPDLSMRDPYFILVILTTIVMILQQKMMTPMTAGDAKGSQKYMGYIMPIFMAVFLYNFPAGLWFYYFLTTIFQVVQQYFVNWEMAKAEATSGGTGAAVDDSYYEGSEEIDKIQEDTVDNPTGREGK
jgi:YidC/Oxa1 family membrane protein insertase